ncbi:hypothetical protein A0H76_3056 [Hepatospora eriocheir]|uniref:Secreted protein n=1 Tax=Hepatospora eriocheir TaxID=1081669 RepID=A0A1X0QC99_9MICR|nr:hypothetical protein A0H76_3056 [Hepatospora eriocheir]
MYLSPLSLSLFSTVIIFYLARTETSRSSNMCLLHIHQLPIYLSTYLPTYLLHTTHSTSNAFKNNRNNIQQLLFYFCW